MSNVLVLNMGMKSIRSIVFDSEGTKIASAALPLETSLNGEWVEQNPSEWWAKAKLVIRDSLKDLYGTKIEYITVTTSSSCLVCVGRNADELCPCIMVSDKRAKDESIILEDSKFFSKVKQATGLGSDPYLMLPKIIWVKRNKPEIYNKVYKFLSPNDFLIAKMTGNFITDYFNAKKYHYDCNTNSYPLELLDELGIEASLLPEAVTPGTDVGRILKSVALEFGINDDAKVIVSTYDAICSFFGSGVAKEGEASDVSGTVTVFRALSMADKLFPSDDIFNINFKELGLNIVGGSNNLGGGLIEWVKQCYYQNEPYPYELMEKDAGEALLGAGGLIFLPYLLGERAPLWNNDARGVFFGLERTHTRKEMTRAVFESTGFIDLDMISAIEQTGMSVNRIRLSGGLARINLVSQIKADITGREILVLSEFETTSTGAAMLVLLGQQNFNTLQEAADCFVSVRMIIEPDKKNNEVYNEIYQLYKDTYSCVKELFVKRKQMVDKIYRKRQVKIENL